MLVTADETGVTAGVDLRMIGGKDGKKALLWQSRNPTGGITCLAVASRPSDGEYRAFEALAFCRADEISLRRLLNEEF